MMNKLVRSCLLLLSTVGFAQHMKPEPVRASYYASKFEGSLMADGKPFRNEVPSAASLMFPLGSLVRVTCRQTGKSIVVPVTDRGPWNKKFGIDLSRAAFKELGVDLRRGWAWVSVSKAG